MEKMGDCWRSRRRAGGQYRNAHLRTGVQFISQEVKIWQKRFH